MEHRLFEDPKPIINTNIRIQGIFAFAYAICSIFLATQPNAGFQVVLTAFLYTLFVYGANHIINKKKSPLLFGVYLGVCFVLIFVSLMAAIYWGELSKCQRPPAEITQFECSNKTAYRAICAFSVFMFLLQLSLMALSVFYKDTLLQDSDAEYERLSSQDIDLASIQAGSEVSVSNSSSSKFSVITSSSISGKSSSGWMELSPSASNVPSVDL